MYSIPITTAFFDNFVEGIIAFLLVGMFMSFFEKNY